MAQAGRDESGVDAGMQLDPRDKIVICLIVFFTAVALTFELYWLIFNQAMENHGLAGPRLCAVLACRFHLSRC
jgi:hypothetical protein